jgi:hypothetical protein
MWLLERLGLFYIRYLDDIVVLAPTRSKLRQAVRVVNHTLASMQPAGKVRSALDLLVSIRIAMMALRVTANN